MKAAIISLEDPYDRHHGGTLRTQAIIDGLVAADAVVDCFYPSDDDAASGIAPPGVRLRPVQRPAIAAQRWPAWLQRLKRSLLPMPTVSGGRNPHIASALRAGDPPDLLVVSMIAHAAYVDALPGTPLWLDHSDLHSEFIRGEISQRRGISQLTAELQRRKLLSLERRYSEAASIVTTAGWLDHAILERRIDGPVDWLPTPIAAADARLRDQRPGGRVAGLFGNFAFWPNVEGYQRLVDVWAPRLSQLGWRVLVAGLDSEQLPRSPDVEVVGALPSPRHFYESVDVSLAPLQIGGGMKVKVVESLLWGRPVFGTEFAAEGFPHDLRAMVHVVDAEDPSFEALRSGAPAVDTSAAALRRFSRSASRAGVADLVRRALSTSARP